MGPRYRGHKRQCSTAEDHDADHYYLQNVNGFTHFYFKIYLIIAWLFGTRESWKWTVSEDSLGILQISKCFFQFRSWSRDLLFCHHKGVLRTMVWRKGPEGVAEERDTQWDVLVGRQPRASSLTKQSVLQQRMYSPRPNAQKHRIEIKHTDFQGQLRPWLCGGVGGLWELGWCLNTS